MVNFILNVVFRPDDDWSILLKKRQVIFLFSELKLVTDNVFLY